MKKVRLFSFVFFYLIISSLHVGQTGNPHLFHSFEEIEIILDSLRLKFPHIISEKKSIGESVQGRDIWVVKISDNPDVDEDEPEIFYNSLIHGTEPMSMMVLINFMNHLLKGYDNDPELQFLIENRELFFLPVFNPDGYVLKQRKNQRDNGDGTYGVDLNRNFGYMWDASEDSLNTSPGSHMYRGPSAFSEPETQAIRDFCINRNFIIANNIHYYGYWIYYPWGYNLTLTADSNKFKTITSLGTELNYYLPSLSYNPTSGTAMDWMYAEQASKSRIYAFTTEVGGEFQNNVLYPTAEEIATISEQNIYPNKIYAWGPGIIEDFPIISNLATSNVYINPERDTLYIYANEESSSGMTDVFAHVIDSDNNIIDTVYMEPSELNETRMLTGRWIPPHEENFYNLNMEQTGKEKPFKLNYSRSTSHSKFTTAGPVTVAIDDANPHNLRDYKIR